MLLSIRLCQHVLNLTPCGELENSWAESRVPNSWTTSLVDPVILVGSKSRTDWVRAHSLETCSCIAGSCSDLNNLLCPFGDLDLISCKIKRLFGRQQACLSKFLSMMALTWFSKDRCPHVTMLTSLCLHHCPHHPHDPCSHWDPHTSPSTYPLGIGILSTGSFQEDRKHQRHIFD